MPAIRRNRAGCFTYSGKRALSYLDVYGSLLGRVKRNSMRADHVLFAQLSIAHLGNGPDGNPLADDSLAAREVLTLCVGGRRRAQLGNFHARR
jgi:hypothetical protein